MVYENKKNSERVESKKAINYQKNQLQHDGEHHPTTNLKWNKNCPFFGSVWGMLNNKNFMDSKHYILWAEAANNATQYKKCMVKNESSYPRNFWEGRKDDFIVFI